MMRFSTASEPIRVSERFRLTLESAILELEAGAAHDERLLPLLEDADHRRRQELLVARQLDRAFRLRELLARTVRYPVPSSPQPAARSPQPAVPRY
jgi:hypothetical protein